jgi:hypothetical protein
MASWQCGRVPIGVYVVPCLDRCLHGALPCFDGVVAFARVRVTAVVRLRVLACCLALFEPPTLVMACARVCTRHLDCVRECLLGAIPCSHRLSVWRHARVCT